MPAGVTQEYTIEFRYLNDPDNDQSMDMGKSFGGQLMIVLVYYLSNKHK